MRECEVLIERFRLEPNDGNLRGHTLEPDALAIDLSGAPSFDMDSDYGDRRHVALYVSQSERAALHYCEGDLDLYRWDTDGDFKRGLGTWLP